MKVYLALSTINRYWQGSVTIRGEIPSFYEVAFEAYQIWGLKHTCEYKYIKSLGGGFNVFYCKEGRSPFLVMWGYPSESYSRFYYSSLEEALAD